MKLRKKKRLFNLFNEYKIDAVLHGHYHESETYFRKGIRFSNAGGSFKGSIENQINVNVITIDDLSVNIEIHHLHPFDNIKIKNEVYDKTKMDKKLKMSAAMSY